MGGAASLTGKVNSKFREWGMEEVGVSSILKNQQALVIRFMGRKNMGEAEDNSFKDSNLGT